MTSPKKLHLKHIIPGFMYAPADDTKDLRLVTEIREENDRHCKIYYVTRMQYHPGFCPRQAIVEGIREGSLICMTGNEYR